MKSLTVAVACVAGVALVVEGLLKNDLTAGAFGIALPFLTLCLLFPMLRRLAVRNALRRPRETVLILIGTLLGTAIITSAGVVGDTMTEAVHRTIYTRLGPVDEVVALPAASAGNVRDHLAKQPSHDVDGVLNVVDAAAGVGVGGQDPRVLSNAHVLEMSFEEGAVFGGDPKATGIHGEGPSPGAVVITSDVANALDVGAGAQIDVYAAGNKRSLRVQRVIAVKGLSGFNPDDSSSQAYNVFVSPGTLKQMATATPGAISYHTLISNTGGVIDGAKRTERVNAQLRQLLLSPDAGSPNHPAIDTSIQAGGLVQEVKKDRIKEADDAGVAMRRLFMAVGSFTIVAGILLLINIFTTLAQERQGELGMLRAMGLTKRALVAAFSIEGFLYGVGSALLGMAFGLGVGRVVVLVASGIFAKPDVDIVLTFHASSESLLRGFVGGLGISMLTVILASLFIARMNVIRAIRELPDPGFHRRRLLGLLIGVLLILASVATTLGGVASRNEFLALMSPDVLVIGTIMFFRRWLSTRTVVTISSVAAIAWNILAFGVLEKVFVHANAAIYVVQGVQLTAFGVMLISANQDRIGSLIRFVGHGNSVSMAVRLGLAYPLARRGRLGLLLAMYSLVIFVLTFIITLSHVLTTSIDEQVAAQSRGSDIEMRTDDTLDGLGNSVPDIPVAAIAHNADVDRIAPLAAGYVSVHKVGLQESSLTDAAGFDIEYLGNGAPALKMRLPVYATDDDAFRAVASSSDLVMIQATAFGSRDDARNIHVGDKIEMTSGMSRSPDTTTSARRTDVKRPKPKVLTVVAISQTGPNVLMSNDALKSVLAPEIPHVRTAYLKTKPGVDARHLANQLSGLYVAEHIQAETIRDKATEGISEIRQFLLLIQGYMAIGLLVGVTGLSVVMVRAVRERRRQIGMLRAMGFPAKAIRRMFLAESAFIAGEGIILGAALALVVLSRVFSTLPPDIHVELSVPWMNLSLLVGATFVASLLVVITPAQMASRIPPSIALRTSD